MPQTLDNEVCFFVTTITIGPHIYLTFVPTWNEMEIAGWMMAVVMGMTLGLLGGGGSTLTVPVLVYLFKMDAVAATGYSLFIVGLSSLFGATAYLKNKLIDLKVVAAFGSASIVAVYLARRVIVPSIPDELLTIGTLVLSRDMGLMMLFALMMIGSSYSMIKGASDHDMASEVRYNYPMLAVQGFCIGILVGLVGAGGGFLIIPALVVFSELPIKTAVGTSLSIIAVNSLLGFLGDLQMRAMDWRFLLSFTALAIVGIFIGARLSRFVPGQRLKPIFGWFVLVMGIYILGKEVFF